MDDNYKDFASELVITALKDWKYLDDNKLSYAYISKDNTFICKTEIKEFLESELGQSALKILKIDGTVKKIMEGKYDRVTN